MVTVDVTEFLVSLLDVHKLQLQALTKQGEIQARVLRGLVKDGLSRTLDIPLSQDKNKQSSKPRMTVENGESAEWCTRLTELLQAEVQTKLNPPRHHRLLDTESWTVEDQSRQAFLSLKYDPHKGVRELGMKLDTAAKHWLRPDLRTAAQVEQCVAMEQFLSLLPNEAAVCVQKQHPRDMEEAISLAERWIGCGDSPHADIQSDSEHGSTDAQEQGCEEIRRGASDQPDALTESFLNQTETVKMESIHLSLEVPDLETPSVEKEQRERAPQAQFVSLVCKQEVVEPDFSEGSEWAQERAPAEPFHMPTSSKGQESVSVSECFPPAERCSLTSAIPTTSSQAFRPSAPDTHQLFVQDSTVTARLRGVHSSMMDAETELSAGYTGLFSQDAVGGCHQTWRTPPRVPSPLPSHLSSPSHQCPDCGCCFTQQRSLREHRNIHTGERPFVCGVCGKAFCHRRTLNKHTRIHSRERPFHCDFCGQTFKLKDTMKRHQMAHCRHTP